MNLRRIKEIKRKRRRKDYKRWLKCVKTWAYEYIDQDMVLFFENRKRKNTQE